MYSPAIIFRSGELTQIFGRSGSGKSALIFHAAMHAVSEGGIVVVFTDTDYSRVDAEEFRDDIVVYNNMRQTVEQIDTRIQQIGDVAAVMVDDCDVVVIPGKLNRSQRVANLAALAVRLRIPLLVTHRTSSIVNKELLCDPETAASQVLALTRVGERKAFFPEFGLENTEASVLKNADRRNVGRRFAFAGPDSIRFVLS